ncbi:MAG: AraC family transcriptional regulator [Lachnospiraceae bacterium]|nr:AraC family transcriptional regulator [Lachnospiraceae bacterium]
MKNLYEYSDRLNAPLTAFNHTATNENFPVLPHWHYFFEILHILEGDVEATCGNYVYILRPGDIIIFFPQLIHSINKLKDNENKRHGLDKSKSAFTASKENQMLNPKYDLKHNSIMPVPEKKLIMEQYNIKYQIIKFDMNFLNINTCYKARFLKIFQLAYNKNPEYIYFSSEMLKDISMYNIFNTCIKEMENRNYGYDIVVCSHISALLSYFARNWIGRGLDIDEAIRISDNKSSEFAGITEYIDKHYNEPIKISSLAGMCGMSYSNFAKLFKQTYHQSCKEYIEFIRLNKAEDLLLMTNLDLTTISSETGFADCSHLIRTFKKWKGVTPGQWRNKNEK